MWVCVCLCARAQHTHTQLHVHTQMQDVVSVGEAVCCWVECVFFVVCVGYFVDICESICYVIPINSDVFLFHFCSDDLSIGESVVLKLPTINWVMLLHFFKSSSRYFRKLGTLEFDVSWLRIVMSSWLTVPLTGLKCPSLSLINFSLKST